MRLLGSDIALAILDMDGTLIDSTGIWAEIDAEFFARRGLEVPEGYGEKIGAMGLTSAASFTRSNYLPSLSEDEILREWRELSLRKYESEIILKPFALPLLERLKEEGVILTLATANSPDLYRPCLTRLGIMDYFKTIRNVTEAGCGKDSPEIFHSIAREYSLSPHNILVIEDSLLPLKAAKESGYLTIGVYDEHSTHDRSSHMLHSNLFVDNLGEILKIIEEENQKN